MNPDGFPDSGGGLDSQRPAPRIAALVLAAGRSSRMGGTNKLLCEVSAAPLVRRVAEAALTSRCCMTLVVTGFEAWRVEAALADCPVSIVRNADFAAGLSTSLICGLRALPRDLDGALVLLADMPHVGAAEIDRLVSAFDPRRPAIVVPECGGRRGNPVLWPKSYFAEMQTLSGDTGAKALIDRHRGEVTVVPFDSEAIFADVDTPAALAGLSPS